jgi:hypothetical protein
MPPIGHSPKPANERYGGARRTAMGRTPYVPAAFPAPLDSYSAQ